MEAGKKDSRTEKESSEKKVDEFCASMEETREFKHNYNVDNNINSILYDDKQQFSADPLQLNARKSGSKKRR